MTDVANTQVLERNLGLKELLAQPNTWKLLSVPFGGLIALTAWLAVGTYPNVQELIVEVNTVKVHQTVMQKDLTDMQGDLTKVQGDLTKVQGDLTKVQGNQIRLQSDFSNMQNDLNEMKSDINELDEKMDTIIDLLNGILPNKSVP